MGSIASPLLPVSPIRTIEGFWPDGMPVFDSEEKANTLMEDFLSLWNHLAQHQKRSKPFKLTVKPFSNDLESMRDFLTVRTEEIYQFLEGLLGDVEELAVPEGIRAEIAVLSENYGLISATLALLNDESIEGSDDDISGLTNNLRELSRIAGVQINDIIMACVRYRRKSARPTLH